MRQRSHGRGQLSFSRNTWADVLLTATLFAFSVAGSAALAQTTKDSDSRTVLGPRNPNLHDGAQALLSKDAEKGVELTLLGLEAALGIETFRTDGDLFKGRVPQLGSHYAFELHEIEPAEFAVRLTYNDDAGAHVVEMDGCDREMCSLNRFLAMAKQIAPANWRKACNG